MEMEEKVDKAIAITRGTMASRTQTDDIQKVAQSVLNLSIVKASLCSMEGIDEELAFVLGKVRPNLDATSLVHLTQAAVNLINANQTLTGKTKLKKQGAGA